MALTELQKSRILFHFQEPQETEGYDLRQQYYFSYIPPNTELSIVGDPAITDSTLVVNVENQRLCTIESLLGQIELAYRKISTATIDDSLQVESVGSVKLRSDELKARDKLYQRLVRQLRNVLRGASNNNRVGYSGC